MFPARPKLIAESDQLVVAAEAATQQQAVELVPNRTSQPLKTPPSELAGFVPAPVLELESLLSHQVVSQTPNLSLGRFDQFGDSISFWMSRFK